MADSSVDQVFERLKELNNHCKSLGMTEYSMTASDGTAILLYVRVGNKKVFRSVMGDIINNVLNKNGLVEKGGKE